VDKGWVASHKGCLLLRRHTDERDGPGGPLAVKDPAVDWGAEELDDWNNVAPEAGLGQHRLLC
jgi:hypothetical protein